MLDYENGIIGKYKGNEPGPLLIITAGMHGNEHAGVAALELLFKMLEVEPITNPNFVYKGEIIGILGNKLAYERKVRYIQQDINRLWTSDTISHIKNTDNLTLEEFEIKRILQVIDNEIDAVNPNKIYLLDLHTTSSVGGIFCITTHNEESIHIGHDIHAPVVLNLLGDIGGTTLHFFHDFYQNIPITSIAFEGGQHENPESVNRCIAAVINIMRSIGTISSHDVENRHDEILLEYMKNLPKTVEVIYRYHVDDINLWQMLPGFSNFEKVDKGQHLAYYNGEPVLSPTDGLLLMPLYHNQGDDGFFIVREV
ncbi:MAG: succinylglutamate desuccinylase/aspartoacylase family protein [Saprospiraceae bacterium]